MFKGVRLRNVIWLIVLSMFCLTSSASTLDLSGYPDQTPLDQVDVQGFTFEVHPGAAAEVNDGQIRMSGAPTGTELRIIFPDAVNNSTITVKGKGSCQLPGDFVRWYLDGSIVDTFENYDYDPSDGNSGRCLDSTLARSFEHDEIAVDIRDNIWDNYVLIGPLSNDFGETKSVPTMSTWAIILLSILVLAGVATSIRKNNKLKI